MKSKTLHPLLVPPLGRVCVCAHTRVHMFMHLVTQLCPTLATPWTVAPQAPLSMGFPRQEYWSSLPFSSPLYLPNSGIEPASLASPALAGGFYYFYFFYFFRRILLMLSHLGSPQHQTTKKKKILGAEIGKNQYFRSLLVELHLRRDMFCISVVPVSFAAGMGVSLRTKPTVSTSNPEACTLVNYHTDDFLLPLLTHVCGC